MKTDKKTDNDFSAILKERGIFELAEKLSKKFSARGGSALGGKKIEIFLVGGAVRDIILGRPVKDIDILARGVKITELEKELKKLGEVNLVGKRFGVLKFLPKAMGLPRLDKIGARNDRKEIDIALPRTDFSFGTGVYRDFKVKYDPNLPVESDLERRDFTINAMAYNIYNGRIVDPFGGMGDLKKKIIRAVGKPEARFKEDYSRMLRAIRFSMQLGFKIETKTWEAIKKHIGHINDTIPPAPSVTKGGKREVAERKVPYEVIASEFLRSFNVAPVETVKKYLECGALAKLLPELLMMKKCSQPKEHHSEGDVLTHTLLALENINSKMFKKYFKEPVSLTTKVAILFHDVGKPPAKKKMDGRTVFYNHDKIGAELAGKILNRLKLSAPPEVGVNIDEIAWLIENHLLFFYAPPDKMKKTTVEKYLFHKNFSGTAHMQLFLADAMATKPEKNATDFTRFKAAYKLWKSLQGKQTQAPPKSFLDGNEIMKTLKIAPGPKVGEVLNLLREEQLQGRIKDKKSAKKFISSI